MSITAVFDDLLGAEATPWPLPVEHLSATQIGMWQRCREQWRRRYVLGERERPGAALCWGSADHAAHEHNFVQKINSHEDLPVEEVQEAFVEAFDRQVERNGGESEVEWGGDKPALLKDAGAALVAVYHRQVSPSVQPTKVEREFTLDLPGVPVPFVGRVDVETAGAAIERKTAKRASKEIDPKWRLQALAYQAVTGKSVDIHVSVKAKTPAVWTPSEAPGLTLPFVQGRAKAAELLIAHTARDMVATWETFGPDEPWEGALSHPWACGFCGFRSSCAWWGQ